MIIGLTGFAGSGKGTVANILKQNHGFIQINFADAVKDAVTAIFGWDRALLEGDTEESRIFRETKDDWWSEKLGYEVTPRKMMQFEGIECSRNILGQNIWIEAHSKKMLSYRKGLGKEEEVNLPNIVISDVRFPNEIDRIHSYGGKVFEVLRKNEVPDWYGVAAHYNAIHDFNPSPEIQQLLFPPIHYSEWAYIGYPVEGKINNMGDLKDLVIEIEDKIILGI